MLKNPNSFLLQKFLEQAEQNSGKKNRGHRYTDETLLRFFMNLRIIGGRKLYEILSSNFEGIVPSTRRIEEKIADFQIPEAEGQVRSEELLRYLQENRLPLVVSLSEDATSVTGKLEYDASLNSISGFGLPLEHNGLPNANRVLIKCVEDIVTAVRRYERASNIMVVMAQPLSNSVHPFRFCSFGTTNKFTADDVARRLNTITSALKKEGIETLTYSADGDSRELKVMRQILTLGHRPINSKYFGWKS